MPPSDRAEVLVVGGGPAGLATAIAARCEGLDVLVVDRARPPIDKACGEGLMPDGLALLRELGVDLDPDRLHPFHGIRYLDDEAIAEGRFPGVTGAGVRRLDLHQALVRRAEDAGVQLRWGVRVEGLTSSGVETATGPLAARWIVGADGLHSRIRRWAGLAGGESRVRRFGIRRHFAVAPWSDCVEVYWAQDCEAYVTPVGRSEVGVAMLWSGWKSDFDGLMARFPRLRERLEGAEPRSRDRGAGPLRQRVRRVTRGRVALVGDASGYVDAITGEGLSLAFHQAVALAAALRRGDLASYARRHRRLGRLPNTLTGLLLLVEKRPRLRRRLIRAFAREPALFSRLLALHVRELPVRRLGSLTGPRLLWRLVWP
ncbi:MAG: NAD(P)/FAD-dependent oxidoreductase [Thermoanaerobaculia bacterium]